MHNYIKRELSEEELSVYSRQIALNEIDYEGQLRLRNAKACVVGMGGLGSIIALKLVAMGVGRIRIIDRDIVSRSDLHRQYLYDIDSVGLPKVEVAFQKLKRLNPDVEIEPVADSFNSNNSLEILKDSDVVLDGLDRPEIRYVLNRASHILKIPYVFAGAIECHGNVSTIVPGKTACLECFMMGVKDEEVPKCAVVGVHPSILAIVTAIEVFEAVRIMIGKEPTLMNKLLYINLVDMNFKNFNLSKYDDCPVCGRNGRHLTIPKAEKFFEETCARDGRRTFIITIKKRAEIDFKQLMEILKRKGFHIKKIGKMGITFEYNKEIQGSLLKSGTIIYQTSPQITSDPVKEIMKITDSILVDGLKFPSDLIPEIY